ncbi:MAG: nucleotide exchange factor GrpE [Prevotella sp.]|nr:nucleotide exchange factor GrpE [Bacteroidales bacterium]MDY4229604.1 nucleotide exchange factor GrpE [Prevotella sp.]
MAQEKEIKEKRINIEGEEPQQQKGNGGEEKPQAEGSHADNDVKKADCHSPQNGQEPKTEEETQNANGKEEQKEQEDPLQKALDDKAKLADQLLRTMAEFDNYRKRVRKEKADLILNGAEKTVTAILPIIDDMERAIANAGKSEDPKKIEEGWELIFQKFNKTLEGLGVRRIDTKDADFNTDFHEAVAMVPGMGDEKKGKVIDCVQTGYTLNDKVIRHAKVAIGQ